jgi:SAM-dependent methyltransferase
MDANFQKWFNRIQEIHTINPERHENQSTYDNTLIENYAWPYMALIPVSAPPEGSGYRPSRVLDVGCAYGSLSIGAKIQGYDVVATDYDSTYANKPVLEKMGIGFHEWDLYADCPIEKSNGLFDVAIFTEVLEHLDFNPIIALLKIRDLLRTGGKLVLSTPRREDSRNWESNDLVSPLPHWSHLPFVRGPVREDRHYHIYSQAELIELLDVCGFRVTSGGVLWNGLSHGLTAYKTAGDCSENAAFYYSEYQRENLWKANA